MRTFAFNYGSPRRAVVGQLSVPRREIRLPNFSKAKDSPFILTLSTLIQGCWGPLSRRAEAVKIYGQKLKINRLPSSQADQNHSQISTTTKDWLNAHARGQEEWWIFRYLGVWNIREPYSRLCSENWSTTVECHTWMQRFLIRIESHQHDRTIIFAVIHIEDILKNIAIYFNFQNMTALCDSNAENPSSLSGDTYMLRGGYGFLLVSAR